MPNAKNPDVTNRREILEAFDGRLVGKAKMKRYVCEVVALMPSAIRKFVTKHCWFVASMDDAWAFAFRGNELKNQFLVFLSDELLEENEDQIYYTIAHEIGHVILGHSNAILVTQTREEIRKQEKEAHEFALVHLKGRGE